MVAYSLLLLLSLVALVQSGIDQVSERLLAAKLAALPGRTTPVILRQEGMLASTEALLVRFLRDLVDPVIILSRFDLYLGVHQPTMHSVVFIDQIEPFICNVLYTSNRRIIVTVLDVFQEFWYKCEVKGGIFVIYDADEHQIYHYNHYTKTMNLWDDLQRDPLLAATDNLAGLSFLSENVQPVDPPFLKMIASHLNGTIRTGLEGDIYVLHIPFQYTEYYVQGYVPMYLHQSEKVFVLVPWINKMIPSIFVITDPFDLASWILIFSSILALSMVRTCITKRHANQNILQNFTLILGTLTIGSQVQYHREIERQLFGVFLLLSVVLVNAYQSLIISYLLSPRFYPELDTLQLINETCCWDHSDYISFYNFTRLPKCSEVPHFNDVFGDDLDRMKQAYEDSFCTIVDHFQRTVHDRLQFLPTESGLFRWSRQTVNEWPRLVWAHGDPLVVERMLALSRIYFAECNLNAVFGNHLNEMKRSVEQTPIRATTVEDLSLVWMIYAVGTVFTVFVFLFEIVKGRSIAAKWKKLKDK